LSVISSNILDNEKDFESFFKEHYNSFCRFAYTFLNDSDDAEEVVQNCFVKLWEGRKTLIIGNSPKSYLFTMIRNTCLNQIKHILIREDYKVFNEKQLSEVEPEAQSETVDLQQKVGKIIQNMPPQRRKIFELSRFEGLKYKEIATHLNISVKTVENHMGSAMKQLREELKGHLHLGCIIFFVDELGDFMNSIVLFLGS
jgi:RNA polymerase sigma-70 factor (ECF subfamily)